MKKTNEVSLLRYEKKKINMKTKISSLLAVLLMIFAGIITSCDNDYEYMVQSQKDSVPLSSDQVNEERTIDSRSSWFNYTRWDVSPIASKNYFVGRKKAEIVVYNAGSIDLLITGRWNNQITTENFNFIIAPGTAHAVKPSGEDEMPYPNLKISVINAEGYANLSAGLAKVAVRYLK